MWVLTWCLEEDSSCISIHSRALFPPPISTMSVLAAPLGATESGCSSCNGLWSLSCVPGGKYVPQPTATGTQGDQELDKTTSAAFPLQLQALKPHFPMGSLLLLFIF